VGIRYNVIAVYPLFGGRNQKITIIIEYSAPVSEPSRLQGLTPL